jgi:hypothetical protein
VSAPPKEPWIFESPYARAGIPSIIGLTVGFLSNLITGLAVNNGAANWVTVTTSPLSFATVALVLVGVVYQVKVHRYDTEPGNVLERAKQMQAAAIADFYAQKIKAGDLKDLKESDETMVIVFGGDK